MNYKFQILEGPSVRLSDIDIDFIPNVLSKSQWKKIIKKGIVFCNGELADTSIWVSSKDHIEIKWTLYQDQSIKPFSLKLEVVYEDDYLAVVNKPPGIPVSGNVFKSLQNALSSNLKRSDVMQNGDQFQTCHRLDYSTSGLVVVAKTHFARLELGKYFEEKNIRKYYYAIVQGELIQSEGKWVQPIKGKPSSSSYKVLKKVHSLKNDFLSLLELSPHTGRTHQLRIHCADNNHCIVGDSKYGNPDQVLKGKGLFLAAYKLQFIHPVTKQELDISIDMPNKFDKLLQNEERRYFNYHSKL